MFNLNTSNLKRLTKLSILWFSLSVLNAAIAQAPEGAKTHKKINCSSNFVTVDDAKLCAFSGDAYAKLKGAGGACKNGYARISGLDFCVRNKPSTHLRMKDGIFELSKSKGKKCEAKHHRAANARFCIDQRLALMRDGSKLTLVNMANADCSALRSMGNKACKKQCQPGFVRTLGNKMCVQWQIAKNGHPQLSGFKRDCSVSDFWGKYSKRGLCLPKLNIVSIMSNDRPRIDRELTTGTSCPSGIPQVITTALPTQSSSSNQTGFGGINKLKMVPAIACSPPGPIRWAQQLD